jgi:hypothetical protein
MEWKWNGMEFINHFHSQKSELRLETDNQKSELVGTTILSPRNKQQA